MKKIIKDSENEFLTMYDRGLAWEMIKLKIRAFFVLYCIKKKWDRNTFNINSEKELTKLQDKIDTNPTQQIQNLYT